MIQEKKDEHGEKYLTVVTEDDWHEALRRGRWVETPVLLAVQIEVHMDEDVGILSPTSSRACVSDRRALKPLFLSLWGKNGPPPQKCVHHVPGLFCSLCARLGPLVSPVCSPSLAAATVYVELRGTMRNTKTRDRTRDVPSQEGHLDWSRPALIISHVFAILFSRQGGAKWC